MSADLARIRATVLDRVTRSNRRSRVVKTVALPVGAMLVAGTAIAAVFAIRASEEAITYSVACYESADLSSKIAEVGKAEATNRETGEVMGRTEVDPLEECSVPWELGILGQTPGSAAATPYPVPPLVACLGRDGRAAVFPVESEGQSDSSDVCAAVGLPVWDPATSQ